MEFYQYILLFLFVSIAARIYFLFFWKKKGQRTVKKPVKEGFDGNIGYESFDNCLEQGYPNDFCARVPLEACVTNCPIGNFLPKKFNVF